MVNCVARHLPGRNMSNVISSCNKVVLHVVRTLTVSLLEDLCVARVVPVTVISAMWF